MIGTQTKAIELHEIWFIDKDVLTFIHSKIKTLLYKNVYHIWNMTQIIPTPMLLTKKTGTKNERQVSGNYQELTSDNFPAFEHFSQKKNVKEIYQTLDIKP